MKFLPIVGRELRESSRRRATYWMRALVAFQAILIGIAAYFINLFNPSIKLGTVLFWGLAGVSMIFCLLAGRRSTADCLSLEKREGTLGLLFLTDLKGYDVVLGKLAAGSVTGLYALLAVFPVLAVPLLTGGMTNGEVERMVAVLTNTFFLSIAIGIFASAISREYRAAMAVNFFLWLALVGAPVAVGVGLAIAQSLFISPLFYSCPIFPFWLVADTRYTAADFWWSLAVIHVLAWALVLGACWIVPRTWGDKPARAASRKWRWGDFGSWISYGRPAGRADFRKQALDANAYFWHAARAWLKPVHAWLFLGLAAVWWFYCWIKNGHLWLDEATFFATAVVLNSTLKLWITLEAGQRLGEDRRSGAFELLLAAPLTVADILGGQLMALRRQFLKPLVVVFCVEAGFLAVLWHRRNEVSMFAALMLALPLDVAALVCVAMRAALISKSPARVNFIAVVRILVLPWVLFGLVQGGAALVDWLAFLPWEAKSYVQGAQWLGITIAVDLIFGLQAWISLRRDFRRLATQSFVPERSRFSLSETVKRMGALSGRIVSPRLRIPVMAAFGIILVLGIVCFKGRPEFPPPITVSITQSNGPLRIFPGGQGVFIVLPDGSLWRWGKTGTLQPRALMPEQVGTNHDWLKAVGNGVYWWGLRSDGTVLESGLRGNFFTFKCSDIGVGFSASIALNKDGTIWTLSGNKNGLVGTVSNWTAVFCRNQSYLALRADGTLWAWGRITSSRNGLNWVNTNIDEPALLCADTNWISLNANGQARNRAGELWDAAYSLPNPEGSATSVCRRMSSNWAADHIESAPYSMNCQIRSNGTLWITKPSAGVWNSPPPSSAWHQVGNRNDWVTAWGAMGTSFGLTADGTLWVWNVDVGRERGTDYRTRIQMLQARVNGRGGYVSSTMPPYLEEPRALMKLTHGP